MTPTSIFKPKTDSSWSYRAVAPAVLLAEFFFFGKKASKQVVAAIVIVCIGVGLSTVTDAQMGSNMAGWLVGLGAITATAAYQIWAGTKQKELSAGEGFYKYFRGCFWVLRNMHFRFIL